MLYERSGPNKGEQKHRTKNFVGLHNQSHLFLWQIPKIETTYTFLLYEFTADIKLLSKQLPEFTKAIKLVLDM